MSLQLSHGRFCRVGLLVVVMGVCCAAVAVTAGEALILPDGFVVPGTRTKKENNPYGYGFDVMVDGPKYVVYSAHTRKGAKVEKEVERPELPVYKRPSFGVPPLKAPSYGEMKATEFDDKWRRQVTIRRPDGNRHEVRQVITRLDPYSCFVASMTHNWSLSFHTAEMDPRQVRRLLSTHPDLVEEDNKPDPAKRVAIATFLKDVGGYPWLEMAKLELEKARREIPGEWPKDVTEKAEKLRTDLDLEETRLVLDDIEAAVGAGRYENARHALANFTPKATEQKDNTRLAVLKAQVDIVQPKFEETYRLLSELIRRETVGEAADAYVSIAGGSVVLRTPQPRPDLSVARLVPAAEVVLAELHAAAQDRVELFANLAKQADQRRRDSKDPGTKPAELLALAITGWLKGKNGADPTPDAAVRCWATREMALAYLREPVQNTRGRQLDAYLRAGNALAPDELAQVISLLPPPFAEDVSKNPGKEVRKADANGVTGVFLRTTAGANPTTYFLRLPPGYHHGRSHPVLMLLSDQTVPAEKLVGMTAPWADKFGYILAAPVWTNSFSGRYDWSGDAHPLATDVLRDVLRGFQADPDKVFLFGLADGANFAFDLGASHPDLFAGVSAMGPSPHPDLFMHYWRNAQILPYFVVTGEMAGDSPQMLRKVYERWMPRGFPALLTQYKGRGVEWYAMEIPRIFDWMSRKTRARGTAALKLNNVGFEPWQVGRDGDDRFYWVGTTGVRPGYQLTKGNIKAGWQPATITADIRQGNDVVITTLGLKNVVIWLEREMIDWTKPVRVTLNGQSPPKYTSKVMQPDLNVMFEELYRSGDRKVLMLGRLEFPTP